MHLVHRWREEATVVQVIGMGSMGRRRLMRCITTAGMNMTLVREFMMGDWDVFLALTQLKENMHGKPHMLTIKIVLYHNWIQMDEETDLVLLLLHMQTSQLNQPQHL